MSVVALTALAVGLLLPVSFRPRRRSAASPVMWVVIIASALIISAAIAQSGIVERILQPLVSRLKTPTTQVPVMAGATALLSMPTKNVGALAIMMMPIALQLGRKTGTSASLLMPMSFMSLLGGLVTLVGTSTPTSSSARCARILLGKPYRHVRFRPRGAGVDRPGPGLRQRRLAAPTRDRQGQGGLAEAVAAAPYPTEVTIPQGWPDGLATLSDLNLAADGVTATALVSQRSGSARPLPDVRLTPGDTLVLEGDQESLDRVLARTALIAPRHGREVEKGEANEEMRSVETVVQADSVLVGESAQRVRLQHQFGVNLLAVGRAGERIVQRLRDITLKAGDVLVLQAGERAMPEAMKASWAWLLSGRGNPRTVRLGGVKRRYSAVLILTLAMILVALKLVPVGCHAFFAAAVAIVAVGSHLRCARPTLILTGARPVCWCADRRPRTPLSEAVRQTGGTDLIAGGLANVLHGVPPLAALGALMITAMACAPFLHNAPTVLVLAPIGVALAQRLHLSPDLFLMAVATGAGCDFLTPIGHQCNTLVMGPGGYRFGVYSAGAGPAPLSVLAQIGVGAPLDRHEGLAVGVAPGSYTKGPLLLTVKPPNLGRTREMPRRIPCPKIVPTKAASAQ